MYQCLYCGFKDHDIEMVKEHMKEEHLEEFYAEYFEDWADEMIILNEDGCIEVAIEEGGQ